MSYSEHEAKHMYRFFQQQTSRNFWPKGSAIKLEETGAKLVLAHDVIARQRKKEKPAGQRFEFVGPRLPRAVQGLYGTVSTIDFTLTPDRFRTTGQDGRGRIVKYLRGTFVDVEAEEAACAKATHLHAKPLAFASANGCALIMDKFPGQRLFDIVEYHADGRRPLDRLGMKKRLELTIALLQALKTQVGEAGLYHLDLKPENVIVDLNANPIAVNIVDFGFSVPVNQPVLQDKGNLLFAAPERLNGNNNVSGKTDLFSMAKMIAEVWGSPRESFGEEAYDILEIVQAKAVLNSLFNGIDDDELKPEDRDVIHKLLYAMLLPDVNKRMALHEALKGFGALNLGVELCSESSEGDEGIYTLAAPVTVKVDKESEPHKTCCVMM